MPISLQSIADTVATNIDENNGSLAITGADFGSASITNLFTSYLPNATLNVVGAVQGSTPGGPLGDVTVSAGTTVSGIGGDGPFLGMGINLVFSPSGNEIALQLLAVTQEGWNFTLSFSQLEDTLFGELVFSPAPCFYLASQNGGGFQEGLFFKGNLQFTEALAAAAWLLGDGTQAQVTGPVEIHQGVPEINLTASMAAGTTLGWFQIAPITLSVQSYVGTAEVNRTPVLTTTLRMDSAIRFHTNSTDLSIPISSEFYPDATHIQFIADLNDLLYLGFSELSSLVNGIDLSVIQFPAGFNLSQTIALDNFVLQVDLAAPSLAEKVLRVMMGIRSASPWTLLSDPTFGTVLSVDQISVSFMIDTPMTTPLVGAAIFGAVRLSSAGEMRLSAVYNNAFSVHGELAEGASINLTQLASFFLDSAPNPDVPPIEVVELNFGATPSTGAYNLAVAVEDAWSISLGSTQLSIIEVAFSMSTEQAGTQASIAGAVRIGPALITLDWQLPGTFSLNGTIPEILLTDFIASLSPAGAEWVNSLPVITLENSSISIQRFQNGGYFLAAGTQVENFGTFEIEFSEIGGRTGFTFGFMLQENWRLTQLSSVFDVALLRDLTFRDASLVLSTNDNPNFSFHSFTSQSGGYTTIAPSYANGVMEGMYLYADVVLDQSADNAMGTVARLLSGIDRLMVSLSIPANYQQTVFIAQLQTHYSLLSTVTFDSLSITIRPFQEYLSLAMGVTLDIHDHQLSLAGGIIIAGADAEIYLRTTTPWVNPFGIRGLTLQAMAVGFVVDNAAVTLEGQIQLGSGSRAITLTAAMEFSLAEEVPDVFLVEEVGTITLADIIHAFVASATVPSQLSQIELFDFRFLIVANPVGWTDLITQQHYAAGIAFSGKARVCSLIPSVTVQVDYSTGIHASGELENPLTIGTGHNAVVISNATSPTRGPFVQINSAQSPYVSMSLALTLFEISQVQVVATVASNAFTLNFNYTISSATSIGALSASASIVNGNQFNFAASCRVDVPSFGPIKVGNYSLGTLSAGFSLAGSLSLVVGPGVAIALTVSGQFVLGGYNMTLPNISVSLSNGAFDGFSQLPSYFVTVLKSQLWSIGSNLFQNAEALFRYVRAASLTLATDIGHILFSSLHIDINAAAQYLASVAAIMRYSVTDVANLLKSGFGAIDQAIARALISARYAIEDVARAVAAVFNYGAETIANLLKQIGCSLSDIASVLKQLFGYSAKEVANFFKSAWNIADTVVEDALKVAGYALDKIEGAMKDVYNWTSQKCDEILYDLNPTHW